MKLSNKNIDAAMRDIEKFFEESGVAQKDKLRLCLVLEESLLRWQEHFGDWKNFNFEVYTKNWFNSPKVKIRVPGAAFNPLKAEDSIIPAAVMQNLLNYEGTGTIYRYENGDIEKLPGDLLEPLSAALRTSPAWLMGWEQEQSAPAVRPITDSELKFALWGDAESIDDADLAAVRQYAEFIKERKHRNDPT